MDIDLMPSEINEPDKNNVTDEMRQDCHEDSNVVRHYLSSRRFFGNVLIKSSLYSISQVGQSTSVIRKIFWLLILVMGLTGCSYEVYRFFDIYLQYPVIIDEEIAYEHLEFPAVTVCNLNRMPKYNEHCLKPRRRLFPTSSIMKHVSCSKLLSGNISEIRVGVLKFMASFTRMAADKMLREIGYQPFELIHSCSYNGETCGLDNFTSFTTIKYGNCYTFNSRSPEDQPKLNVSMVGPKSGLELELDIQADSYLNFEESVGARVVVHDPTDLPKPEEEGFNVTPGHQTYVSITKTSIKRLPTPYRDGCVSYGQNKNDSEYANQLDCAITCLQDINLDKCGCVDPFLPAKDKKRHCHLQTTKDICCLEETRNYAIEHGTPCSCPLPCITTSYELEMFAVPWPAKSFYKNILKQNEVSQNVHKIGNVSSDFLSFIRNISCNAKRRPTRIAPDATYMQENRAKIRIYYSTLDHKVFNQKPMFSETEIFSNVGGNLGIWMGVSLIAILEFVEDVFFFCEFLLFKCCFSKDFENN